MVDSYQSPSSRRIAILSPGGNELSVSENQSLLICTRGSPDIRIERSACSTLARQLSNEAGEDVSLCDASAASPSIACFVQFAGVVEQIIVAQGAEQPRSCQSPHAGFTT